MKKIIILCLPLLGFVVYKLPVLHKMTNFKAQKQILNMLPEKTSLLSSDEFVVITDEIVLFKKYLVEVPIDLEKSNKEKNKLMMVSSDDKNRKLSFALVPVEGSKEDFTDYDSKQEILITTYDKNPYGFQLLNLFQHSNMLKRKLEMIQGAKNVFSFNKGTKKGFIFDSQNESECNMVSMYLEKSSFDIELCNMSEKEERYILGSFKKNDVMEVEL